MAFSWKRRRSIAFAFVYVYTQVAASGGEKGGRDLFNLFTMEIALRELDGWVVGEGGKGGVIPVYFSFCAAA